MSRKDKTFSITGIVLAGGKSKRIGQDKRFLKIENESLVERTVRTLKGIFPEIIIVAENINIFKNTKSAKVLEDEIKEIGPIGGIYTGLNNMTTDYGFFVACDIPFLNIEIIREEISLADEYDIVAPKYREFVEPLHTVFSKRCKDIIKSQIDAKDYKTRNIFELAHTYFLEIQSEDVYEKAFYNINTLKEVRALNGQFC